ncbi:MAG: hypothetical protein IPM23_03955 [Candidatus Melainabacteria bacterium]|nr:hypothetical protein [Candidatus Melainabacteria bacterium]
MTLQINITTDWEGTPGWEPMGVGLPDSFLEGEPSHVLATIAMLCMQPRPKEVEPHPQALATLALYASGCAVTLSTRQFRRLERAVLQYMDVVGGEDRFIGTRNWDFASYVRNKAVERAQREKII